MPVRLFYDFLMEEGLRESNPVGRGRYTPGGRAGGAQRGLVPRLTRLPWIPAEQKWLAFLEAARSELPRNRVGQMAMITVTREFADRVADVA